MILYPRSIMACRAGAAIRSYVFADDFEKSTATFYMAVTSIWLLNGVICFVIFL